MHADGWHLTDDIDEFQTTAGTFLRSRPARHTMHLTTRATELGYLTESGEIRTCGYA